MNSHDDVQDAAIADPPPPYPDPQRRHHRSLRSHRRLHPDTLLDSEPLLSDDDDGDTTESTPFLLTNRAHTTRRTRQHSFSHDSSSTSSPTSLSQTLSSLIYGDDDDQVDVAGHLPDGLDDTRSSILPIRAASWNRYFSPLTRTVYYRALLHLLVLNFPYALIAWIYLFVFTVTGTTSLIALPLGAILCFLNLLGARVFSRGELYLQIRFHQVHPPSYQPRPLFTRLREPSGPDYESGRAACDSGNSTGFRSVKEHSFYKNTYAMFTDPTSYQALFYFLVIKPAITLLITPLLIAIGIPFLILVLPAPILLRAVRKIGMWQANVAIEGLYHPLR